MEMAADQRYATNSKRVAARRSLIGTLANR
jgi:crotonobetainyl-CoA:carnitine CoA-transferase CaiB-like acyl-CoA transferase